MDELDEKLEAAVEHAPEAEAQEQAVVSEDVRAPSGPEAQASEEIEDEGPSQIRSDALIEALIFASGEPVDLERLCAISTLDKDEVVKAIEILQERYVDERFGFELVQIAGKYQFRTKTDFGLYLRELKADRPRRLTNAALETLREFIFP